MRCSRTRLWPSGLRDANPNVDSPTFGSRMLQGEGVARGGRRRCGRWWYVEPTSHGKCGAVGTWAGE